LIVFVLGTTSAHADDVYVAKIAAPCRLYTLASGQQICGYADIEDWKKVLVVDLELSSLREKTRLQEEKIENLEAIKQLHLKELDALTKSQETLTKANEKLTKQLIELDRKYQDERVKPRWGAPVAWSIAAVSTSILVGFIVHEALR